MISFEDVHYSYRVGPNEQVKALNGVNLKIRRGQFVAVVGGNGSGKSTLAKHINALLIPDRGRVVIDCLDTSCEQNIWEIRSRVGMVFQNPDNQLVAAVCEEDVAFGPENLGLNPEEIRRRVNYYLDLLNLAEYKDQPPHVLSGGQKQRLAIAGALAMEPQCLVLDEPTSMIDPAGRAGVMEAVIKLNRRMNITIVLITHLMDEVVHADRVLLMDKGKIIIDEPPRELFSRGREIDKYGLVLPGAARMAEKLQLRGFSFASLPLKTAELVESLCGQLK
ncbi:MAG: energy-coupling factor transporter ATPase [Desulfotomaculum sp.]|nr:energy-coupling factor transporter ATPase [Desulfotomaculum sp.]